MDDRASCIAELDACFVACEEAYVRLRAGSVATRAGSLANALLLAAATSTLASESLAADPGDDRAPVLVAITADACRGGAEACARDGAHWLAPVRDACLAAAGACEALGARAVGNGDR